MGSHKKGIWVTWEKQRRNQGISSALGWKLCEVVYKNKRVIRYVRSLYKTLQIIIREKPNFVAAQNPSILLALTVVIMKKIFRYKSIVDAHNAGIFPLENNSLILNYVARYIQSKADLTIVTNKALATTVIYNKGRAVILPDKVPTPPSNLHKLKLSGQINLAYICSFSSDEPYLEVIEAARVIPSHIYIYVTGNHNGKIDQSDLPNNLKLLGFIPEKEYWDLISSVDGIIVLTKREDCLTCGAYEGVALGKPMILSKTKAIMGYFSSGCVYTEPKASDIKAAILQLADKAIEMKFDVSALKSHLLLGWTDNFDSLLNWIDTAD